MRNGQSAAVSVLVERTGRMTLWERWVRQPQSVWLRKALFQVHLWTGIGVGLYILVASFTGSAVVFRGEISRALAPAPIVAVSGPRLSIGALTTAARAAYPDYDVKQVSTPKKANLAVVVSLARGRRLRQRLFDPYTGKDMGPAEPHEHPWVTWVVDLHDDLLAGHTGRVLNGIGAILTTILCLTGVVVWWPGIASWRRSLAIRRGVSWKRFNWDLHSAVGFWMFVLVLMWAFTGIYLAFPDPFAAVVDYIQPLDPASRIPRSGDDFLAWLAAIHFGREYGTSVKTLWVILGLAPSVLFVTGVIMWWNRVLKKGGHV